MLVDAGSKNGVLIDGERIERVTLEDQIAFELGHSFFIYRDAIPAAGDVDCSDAAAEGLATLSPQLAERFRALERVARSAASVVVGGESGTGKELIARAVHRLSGRAGSFVAVNCGAIAANLVESELFGSKKGAFSGATEDRPGLVRSADGGTLFLDEIGDLPLQSQAAFLRVLQEREVVPVGGTRPLPVDIRLVAATHRDLDALVAGGSFRADLLARIAGFDLEMPPLRERLEDMGLLVAALLRRIDPAGVDRSITRGAARALFAHHWPLNVRELEKCLETAVALAGTGPIDLAHLPDSVREPAPAAAPANPAELSSEDSARRDQIVALLTAHRGNVSQVAREMGKARPLVHRWIKRYGIDPAAFR
jgi:sigma-54 dependent transcriptional regulator, acetoin dehydrogenase operon transcriptional activator AcoR